MPSTLVAEERRFCLGCNYCLDGLDQLRCPECGRRFSLIDSAAFSPRPLSWFARRMLGPGWVAYLGAFIGASSWFISAMAPGGWRAISRLATMLWIVVSLVWIMHLVCRGILIRRIWRGRPAPSCGFADWVIVPSLLIIGLVVSSTHYPLKLGFWISRPGLEALADRSTASQSAMQMGGSAGIYRFPFSSKLEDELFLPVAGADGGFLHSKAPAPGSKLMHSSLIPLKEAWYAWIN